MRGQGQAGFLEPAGELAGSPYTVEGIFGKAAPSPLVMTSGPADNYLEIGGLNPVVTAMSGVQTVDVGLGPVDRDSHQPHVRNLLRPMHSEAFWVLLLGLVALGLFSGHGNLRLGPVKFSGGIGK